MNRLNWRRYVALVAQRWRLPGPFRLATLGFSLAALAGDPALPEATNAVPVPTAPSGVLSTGAVTAVTAVAEAPTLT